MDFLEWLVGGADKHSRKITIFLIVLIVLLIGFLAIHFVFSPLIKSLTAPTQISFNTAPASATITINGQEFSNGVYEIEPGEYKIEIKKDGFESKTDNIIIKPHKTNVYYGYVVNKTDGMSYFEQNQTDLDVLSHIDTDEVKNFQNDYQNKLKVRDILPIKGTYNMTEGVADARSLFVNYTIREGNSSKDYCKNVFCIIVESGSETNENLKLTIKKELSKNGYDIANYEIKYDKEN